MIEVKAVVIMKKGEKKKKKELTRLDLTRLDSFLFFFDPFFFLEESVILYYYTYKYGNRRGCRSLSFLFLSLPPFLFFLSFPFLSFRRTSKMR